jgi:cytochrome c oxidase cbb3-type subunit III
MKKYSQISLFLLFGFNALNLSAEDIISSETESIWSNPLFLSMSILATVLLFVIMILANVLKVSIKTKVREIMANKKTLSVFLVLSGLGLNAQTEVPKDIYQAVPIGGIHPMSFLALFIILLLELFVILWLCLLILRVVVKKEEAAVQVVEEKVKKESVWFNFLTRKVLGVAPVAKDQDVLLDHDYDGIKELDNDLPPWWKYGFYLTIVTGAIYLIGYHVTGSFKLSEDEYKTELAEADEAVKAYRLKMAMNVDETNAVFLSESGNIQKGKAIFDGNCVTCHGSNAEGGIGPNLTDKYWLYGGAPGNLFKTVSNGTSKGMLPWKDKLSPVDIQNVISFVHSLQGSNPANAKASEGEVFNYSGAISNQDSSTVLLPDSMVPIEIK